MAKRIYRLHNQIKHYEWGSSKLIPEFLGLENQSNTPYAEMWMGTHKSAPSLVELCNGGKSGTGKIPLSDISGELPFLFKLLAVDKPLSIQAHPGREDAIEGFRLEEEAGVDIRSPMRNYKDPNPKPELLCAITPFTFMAGFRDIGGIKKSLDEFLQILPQLREIISPLQRSLNTGSLAVFFRILFELSDIEREYIGQIIRNAENMPESSAITLKQWSLMKTFAFQYPEDPAIISPLYLNYLTLEPGQAVYLPPGVLHSYISGFGAEIMLSSDNVLRGGLTPKYINIPELMKIIDFKPHAPQIYSPDTSSWFCYGSGGFFLAIMESEGAEMTFPGKSPAICLVTNGEMNVESAVFKKGDSFYISKNCADLVLRGNFRAFFAFV